MCWKGGAAGRESAHASGKIHAFLFHVPPPPPQEELAHAKEALLQADKALKLKELEVLERERRVRGGWGVGFGSEGLGLRW